MVLIGLVTGYLMYTQAGRNSYLYLYFFMIPANTAISVFPHEPVLIYYGTFANIWVTSLVASAGTITAAYLDHLVFTPLLNLTRIASYKDNRFYLKATKVFMRYPFATLFAVATVPIPFFPFKFLSFSIHYPLWRYVTAVTLARFPRYLLLAWIGAKFGVPKELLIAVVAVVFGVYLIKGAPQLLRMIRTRRQAAAAAEAVAAAAPTEMSDER